MLSCFAPARSIDFLLGFLFFSCMCYSQHMYMWLVLQGLLESQILRNMVSIDGTKDIPAYYIDQYEYPNEEGVLPIAGLSLEEAQELCAKQRKTIVYQCRMAPCVFRSDALRYGYGSTPVFGTCNQSPAQTSTHTSMMSTEQFVPSGSFPDCKTSFWCRRYDWKFRRVGSR